MTDERLDEIERVARACDPGLWEIEREELSAACDDEEQEQAWPERVGPLFISVESEDWNDPDRVERNVRFVSVASTAVLELVAEVRRLRAERGEVRRG